MATKLTPETDSTQRAKAIVSGYSNLDALRTAGLGGLTKVRTAQLAMIDRELKSTDPVNAPDSGAAASLTAAAEGQKRLIAALKKETVESSTKLPARDKKASVVHGFVMKSKGDTLVPAAKVTVEIHAAGKQGARTTLAKATTDSRGYYSLSVPAPATREKPAPVADAPAPSYAGVIAVLSEPGSKPLIQADIPLDGNSLSYRPFVLPG